MWLRDQLPKDITSIRTILYGYDTQLAKSESFQTIDDIALSFVVRLKAIGRSSPSAKPLLFLVHSLGGIILKRALMLLATSSDTEMFMLDAVNAIILFGVPNRGMYHSHLLAMVGDQPNEALIKLLSPGSSYLSDLDDRFSGVALLRNIRLISVYETQRSQLVEVSSQFNPS